MRSELVDQKLGRYAAAAIGLPRDVHDLEGAQVLRKEGIRTPDDPKAIPDFESSIKIM